MNRHYHITMGMEGGYMPDVNCMALTKNHAGDIAMEYANEYRQDWDVKYIVDGNKNDGYYIIEKNAPSYRLGTIISINLCYEMDCMEYFENGIQ